MSRQLPVNRFTTTAQGLVPAPGTAGGLFLRDDGTWASVPGGFVSPLTTKGDVLGFDTVNNRIPVGADGTVLTADSTQALGVKWQASAGSGTVTSVGLADASGTALYTITGSPVTTSGTLTATLTAVAKNTVFAGPLSGANAQPIFRSLAAVDGAAGLGSNVTTLTQAGGASQVYTVPAGAKVLQVVCVGGGGGGGSGGKFATNSGGGGGGGGGGIGITLLSAALLGPTVTVTFSNTAGGTGGVLQSTATSNGLPGTTGSNANFGGFLISTGGSGGAGGTIGGAGAGGGGGTGIYGTGLTGGSAALGGASAGTAQSSTSFAPGSYAPTGGGGGGSLNASTPGPGAAGGGGGALMTLVGGTAGGGTGAASNGYAPASGGGGGGASTTVGVTGGLGGSYGGGGGGGGATLNAGTNSGAGGNGGPAACIIIAF